MTRVLWTPETVRDLERRLVQWAQEETRTRGRFTVSAATRLLRANRDVVQPIVYRLRDQGHVIQYGRRGFAWVGIDPPITSVPLRNTLDLLSRRREALLAWARTTTAERGHFTRPVASSETGIPTEHTKRILSMMKKDGEIERLPGSLGYRATGVDGPDVSVRSEPARWTEMAVESLEAALYVYAEQETRERGGFSISAASRDLADLQHCEPIESIVHQWKRAGRVEFLNNHHGWALRDC
jgi:hypothetical protein